MQQSYQPQEVLTSKDDNTLKSHFITREGTYKLMTLSEYSRPNRVPLNAQAGNNVGSALVRVSFLTVPKNGRSVDEEATEDNNKYCNIGGEHSRLSVNEDVQTAIASSSNGVPLSMTDPSSCFCPDRMCFNIGRELYVYNYRGVCAADLSKPIDKRVYKGTYPTCHDFNQETATIDSCNLIIGFSAGQIQLIDPFRKECQLSRLYNEDRFIDKTRVTCLKWVPGQTHSFLASHASGNMYLYNEELPCNPGAPAYQLFKQGEGYSVYTCKTKSTRNPMYRWAIGEGSINEFAFSSLDAKFLAVAGHDGYLRIFNYHAMELVGYMRSYFGGLLCLAWSPDSKYIVTGGEDDLITVFSVQEKRIVCRGQGHSSWVSQVKFDPYMTWLADGPYGRCGVPVDLGSEEDLRPASLYTNNTGALRGQNWSATSGREAIGACVTYRIGSVGHDTQLCLWDLTEDILSLPASFPSRHRVSTVTGPVVNHSPPQIPTPSSNCFMDGTIKGAKNDKSEKPKKLYKRGFSLGNKLGSSDRNTIRALTTVVDGTDGAKSGREKCLLGTPACPRMQQTPVIEPLVCKKIAHDRLTVLHFRHDAIVTACQEGFVCTWARPGKGLNSQQQNVNSPNPGNSPNLLAGGTVV